MKIFLKASIVLLGLFYFSCTNKKSIYFKLPLKSDSLFFYLYERNDSASTERLITVYNSGYTEYKKRIGTAISKFSNTNKSKIDALRISAIRYNFFDLNDCFNKEGQGYCVIVMYMRYKENYDKWVKSDCSGPKPLLMFKEDAFKILNP